MRLLLDTHILLALGRGNLESLCTRQSDFLNNGANERFGSVASLWEMTIKVNLNKLDLGMSPLEYSKYLSGFGINWLPVTREHAAHVASPLPQTRDPFDRMLLSQCAVEGMKLVTIDRMLIGHPLVAIV
jgi:PIN domain nuclease of toxin-antitoxin system